MLVGVEVQLYVVVYKVSEIVLVFGIEERRLNLLSMDSDSVIFDLLNRENMKMVVFGLFDGGSSFLSFILLEDWLDLSNWFFFAICNSYRRKGILKFYYWQVNLVFNYFFCFQNGERD